MCVHIAYQMHTKCQMLDSSIVNARPREREKSSRLLRHSQGEGCSDAQARSSRRLKVDLYTSKSRRNQCRDPKSRYHKEVSESNRHRSAQLSVSLGGGDFDR